MFARPRLGGSLHGIPWRAERRGVGQVEFADLVDGESGVQRGGVGVDAFGGLGAQASGELGAEEASGLGVAGDAEVDLLRAGLVALVVVGG